MKAVNYVIVITGYSLISGVFFQDYLSHNIKANTHIILLHEFAITTNVTVIKLWSF